MHSFLARLTPLIIALGLTWTTLHAIEPAIASLPDSAEIVSRSVVAEGDLSRLKAVLAKAQRGEPVTLGFIGGSITQGAIATKPANRYVNRVADWWKTTFPHTRFTLVNAGIGATNSLYGSLRAQRDLLSRSPDFVVVDFAVNDKAGPELAESYEGLVRQILKQPQAPAVVLLFMSRNDGINAQEWQEKIGSHYQLPMISYRNAFWPELQSGRVQWSQIGADYIHPNNQGHASTATFITTLLEKGRVSVPVDAASSPVSPTLPSPVLSDAFERTTLLEAADLQPLNNEGWTYMPEKKAWVSSTPGSVIEFKISGTRIFLMDYHINGPMGKVRVQVDKLPPVTRDGWFEKTWGGYRETLTLVQDIPAGPHRVRFELLEEAHPQSTGHEFQILGLGATGLTGSHSTEQAP
ncbi:SGNH/GDSL hydrolase family protein [Rariglobus hedericola]|uniref:SGNH/GDSL hydrolase family protein n=1 Tax=Rariglobus hedericola TaxID=2597822 RepID=A0A556QPI4_9BACT|nr:SGNH/GDSL hydrolase family protein [Rariglobus hedericola]